ncbi:MAG: transposase [Planctomycetaceae bacterium]
MLANTNEGFQTLITFLAEWDVPHVILEASGGYERALTDALQDAGIRVSVVQPACVRHFALSLKVLAKTDAIDATVIARFGEATQPAPTEKASPSSRKLRALTDRRTQLIEDRTREKNRQGTCFDQSMASEIKRSIKRLTITIEKIDLQIQNLIAQEEHLSSQATALQTTPASALKPRTLFWLTFPNSAPSRAIDRSHRRPGSSSARVRKMGRKARIYGGRKAVRTALYMAAKSAARHCPHIHPFYQRLRDANKPYNVAIIACARKLLIRLNTLIKKLNSNTPDATLST